MRYEFFLNIVSYNNKIVEIFFIFLCFFLQLFLKNVKKLLQQFVFLLQFITHFFLFECIAIRLRMNTTQTVTMITKIQDISRVGCKIGRRQRDLEGVSFYRGEGIKVNKRIIHFVPPLIVWRERRKLIPDWIKRGHPCRGGVGKWKIQTAEGGTSHGWPHPSNLSKSSRILFQVFLLRRGANFLRRKQLLTHVYFR